MWYKNIQQLTIKNRNLSLFEIYQEKNDMLNNKNVIGFSVRFASHHIKRQRFLNYFNETERDFNIEDDEYGKNYWDFNKKENAIQWLKSLEIVKNQ